MDCWGINFPLGKFISLLAKNSKKLPEREVTKEKP